MYALGQPRTDDEIIAQVLILTWAIGHRADAARRTCRPPSSARRS